MVEGDFVGINGYGYIVPWGECFDALCQCGTSIDGTGRPAEDIRIMHNVVCGPNTGRIFNLDGQGSSQEVFLRRLASTYPVGLGQYLGAQSEDASLFAAVES